MLWRPTAAPFPVSSISFPVCGKNAEKYGIVYSDTPPYTVLQTADISRDEIYKLSQISDLIDRFYSSGKFARCLDFALKKAKSPFDFYEKFSEYIAKTEGRGVRKLSQTDAFRVLYAYVKTYLNENDSQTFEELMHIDFAEHEARRMPLSVISGEMRKNNNGK